jgi:ATP-dependent phosphoenolpyruvate carboxykinase
MIQRPRGLSILKRDVDRFYNFLRGFTTEVATGKEGKPSPVFSDLFAEEPRFFQT